MILRHVKMSCNFSMKETAILNVSEQTVYTGTEQVYLTACPERPCRSAYYFLYFEHRALWHPRCPKMSLSERRKVDAECRVFQEKWSSSYLFTDVNGKPVCLVCSQQVSVLKEHNLRWLYAMLHAEKCKNLQGQLKKEKVNELLAGPNKQQSAITRS